MSESSNQRLNEWLDRLTGPGSPVFAITVRDVTNVASNRQSSADDLSEVISRDAAMVARLVKIANSSLFNLPVRVDTISAAVVRLGFDAIRELAVSVAVIEQMRRGQQHDRVQHHMAHAFHAAAQARAFSAFSGDPCPEEVFVAALLRRVGEMAFWSKCGAHGDAIAERVAAGADWSDAERDVLGFRLNELTRHLVSDWSLGDLLQQAVDDRREPEGRTRSVMLGHEVAEVIETYGWGSAETEAVLDGIAEDLEIDRRDLDELVQANVEQAIKIAERYGVAKVEDTLPRIGSVRAAALERHLAGGKGQTPAAPAPRVGGSPTTAANPEEAGARLAQRSPDPAVQLRVLTELSAGLEHGRPVSDLIQLVLEGVHGGIGFDRTYFALLTPDRTQLKPKYSLGANPADFARCARDIQDDADPFRSLFDAPGPQRLTGAEDRAGDPWMAATEYVATAVSVGSRPVGVLYADRFASRGTIDDAALDQFRHFAHQAVLVLGRSASA